MAPSRSIKNKFSCLKRLIKVYRADAHNLKHSSRMQNSIVAEEDLMTYEGTASDVPDNVMVVGILQEEAHQMLSAVDEKDDTVTIEFMQEHTHADSDSEPEHKRALREVVPQGWYDEIDLLHGNYSSSPPTFSQPLETSPEVDDVLDDFEGLAVDGRLINGPPGARNVMSFPCPPQGHTHHEIDRMFDGIHPNQTRS